MKKLCPLNLDDIKKEKFYFKFSLVVYLGSGTLAPERYNKAGKKLTIKYLFKG